MTRGISIWDVCGLNLSRVCSGFSLTRENIRADPRKHRIRKFMQLYARVRISESLSQNAFHLWLFAEGTHRTPSAWNFTKCTYVRENALFGLASMHQQRYCSRSLLRAPKAQSWAKTLGSFAILGENRENVLSLNSLWSIFGEDASSRFWNFHKVSVFMILRFSLKKNRFLCETFSVVFPPPDRRSSEFFYRNHRMRSKGV